MANSQYPDWPDEVKAYHRELYDLEPTLSHRKIAEMCTEKFGRTMTRNASIGLAHRGDYPRRRRVHIDEIVLEKRLQRRARERRRPLPRPKPSKPAPNISEVPMPFHLSLVELTDKTCKWPVSGEKAETRFCGRRSLPGKSYCAGHNEMAWQYHKAPKKGRGNAFTLSPWISKRVVTAGG